MGEAGELRSTLGEGTQGDRSEQDFSGHWGLDPAIDFLNHGSFGACPISVLETQGRLRRVMERHPVLFLHREFEARADAARRALSEFLGADPEGLAFVPNATAGVNTVLRSLVFAPGDELLVSDHEYNACRNAIHDAAARTGARVVTIEIPFPLSGPDEIVEAVLGAVSPRTRLLLIDHVTSATGMILPVERITREMERRGIDTLVDGAHAPGMIPVALDRLGAAYYTGNGHKWLCAPKGAAFLWVRADRRHQIRPLSISHGMNAPRTDRSFFRLEFDWTGTHDPTPHLCLPEAITFLESLLPGGWPEIMRRNRTLTLRARDLLCARLGVAPPCPEEMIGSLATIALPDSRHPLHPVWLTERLQLELWDRHRIETVVTPWPAPPRRWLRLSAQLYNRFEQFERLAAAVEELVREF